MLNNLQIVQHFETFYNRVVSVGRFLKNNIIQKKYFYFLKFVSEVLHARTRCAEKNNTRRGKMFRQKSRVVPNRNSVFLSQERWQYTGNSYTRLSQVRILI